jgi:CDP-diacylglycerol--glycerol-3-phosphate 3-phosphatidyltransferase
MNREAAPAPDPEVSGRRESGNRTEAAAPEGAESPQGPSSRRPRLVNLPNQLTVARLVLSLVFFVLLGVLGAPAHGGSHRSFYLNLATLVFVLAVVTDFLDGFLARRWHLESTFGRIADPFADKIVICGGFIMLTGVSPALVQPWFAVLIVFREFLVSGLRSFLESRGVAFGAALSGKLKMIVQSVTIPAVLVYEANFKTSGALQPGTAATWTEDLAPAAWWLTVVLLVLTQLFTLGSCVGYVQRAAKLLRE